MNENRKIGKHQVKAVCIYCGKEFDAKLMTAKFCSDLHRLRYNREKKRIDRNSPLGKINALEAKTDAVLATMPIVAKSPEFKALMRIGTKIASALKQVES